MSEPDLLLEGVCCNYCAKFETADCPLQTASPWSRWNDFCGQYVPNPGEPDAMTIAAAIAKAESTTN